MAQRHPQRQQYLERARALAPVVEAEAAASERAGTLGPATVEALAQSHLLATALPTEAGGVGLDPLSFLEVVEEVARQDGSAGWCLGMNALIAGIAGSMLDDDGVKEVFPGPEDTFFAGGFPPQGRAHESAGGFEISGRFRFGSGCLHAHWMALTCLVCDGDRPRMRPDGMPEMRTFCVRREEVTIHDNWQVAGLEGTASCDYSVEKLPVKHSLSFSTSDWKPLRGREVYTMPLLSIAAAPHMGFALGVGRRALEEIAERAGGRQRLGSAATLAARPAFQRDFGRVETRFAAARSHARLSLERIWQTTAAGDPVTLDQRADVHGATALCYEAAAEAADVAFRAAGGAAIFRDDRLQRCFRDIHAGMQHIIVSEESWERVGQVRLGAGVPTMI